MDAPTYERRNYGQAHKLRVSEEGLTRRAKLRAVADHKDDPGVEAYEPATDAVIVSIEFFDRVYRLTPEDIGEIDVCYSHRGYRAIYGFTADGMLSLYMD